jgi:RHS repeat-associated protein
MKTRLGNSPYSYDPFGNITEQVHTELGVRYTTAYAYDAGDRVISMTYPDGREVTYLRDAIGRITAITTTVNAETTTLLDAVAYRADGLLTARRFGNGLSETRAYDLQGHIKTQALGAVGSRAYRYDANANLTALSAHTLDMSYAYDALDRLEHETVASASQRFSYDPNANRTRETLGITTLAYRYTPASNRLEQLGDIAVTLDAAGHTTAAGPWGFRYNGSGRLARVVRAARVQARYAYNAQGLRTRKLERRAAGPRLTLYHYDVTGRLIAETRADRTLIRTYVWAEGRALAQIEPTPGGETLLYLHTDHLNTPRLATDPEGTVIWRWEGAAFGNTPPNEDPDGDGSPVTINLRFPGQYYDQETGLHYNWNRYYDPRTGRYITSDPIGLLGGINTYAYVGSNPLVRTDVFGLDWTYDTSTGTISQTDANGNVTNSWPAGSGPWGNGQSPPGDYTLPSPPVPVPPSHPNQASYCIHPDGNVPGTAGCIGATDNDTTSLRDALANDQGLLTVR